ncbi:MAG TPA: response regulator [Coleofasciculaceae cyanobacterium]|jgi:CheY-like chemotaxis protein
MKIMVVDDEVDVQLLFTQKFRREIKAGKIKFHFAFSGHEALEYLNSQDDGCVVLILSDINMPGMNGLELLKIIKDSFPQLKVYMITAYGDEQNYQVAMDYGADDYLHKPVEFDKLKERILNFC